MSSHSGIEGITRKNVELISTRRDNDFTAHVARSFERIRTAHECHQPWSDHAAHFRHNVWRGFIRNNHRAPNIVCFSTKVCG